MKKIINGKVYDTEKAKAFGSWSKGDGWRDFSYREETLYRKKTGEFFLFGEGGPATNYAERIGNAWSNGSRIMPMSYSEAKAWAEEKLSGDEYEEIFGAIAEDGSRQQICLSLSATTAETIRRRASELGISASEFIERCVNSAN